MQNIPLQLLVEAEEHIVTVELDSGEALRGKLIHSEDNMNIELRDVAATSRDGKVTHKELVYIRGSHISMLILPEMLRNAPVLRPDLVEQAHKEAESLQQAKRKRRKNQ